MDLPPFNWWGVSGRAIGAAASAAALHAVGRRFESCIAHHSFYGIKVNFYHLSKRGSCQNATVLQQLRMAKQSSRKRPQSSKWPHKISLGRVTVSVYRRKLPNKRYGYQVANYSTDKRRLDSYPTEDQALEAAHRLARQLSKWQVLAASLSNQDAAAYASAIQSLEPHNIPLPAAAATLAKCLETVDDLPTLLTAVKFYATRNKTITRKRVADVVDELLAVKEARQASLRYLQDLQSRLGRFATAFQKNCCDVTTAHVQGWLDRLKLSTQSYENYRRTVYTLFGFAVARGYAVDNPVKAVERVKVRPGEVAIYTPTEIRKLLASSSSDFLPCLGLGAFAGVRSAEIERLKWSDIRLADRIIVVGKDQAKTASRRTVPISENLALWLAPYAGQTGLIWKAGHHTLYDVQRKTANQAGLKWKKNALRHSYASYRFAQTTDAGRVAGELGNSVSTVHKHYRELVTPTEAKKWFNIKPTSTAANIISAAYAN